MPPIGRFSHKRTPWSKETSITLQDGCFGVATLMRISTLFIPSTKLPEGAPSASAEKARRDSIAEHAASVPQDPDRATVGATQPAVGFSPLRGKHSGGAATPGVEGPPPDGSGSSTSGAGPERQGAAGGGSPGGPGGTEAGGDFEVEDPQGALQKAAAIAEAAVTESEVRPCLSLQGETSDTEPGGQGHRDSSDGKADATASKAGGPEKEPLDKSDRFCSFKGPHICKYRLLLKREVRA